MPTVFHDDGSTLENFAGESLVRCPRCRDRASAHAPRDGRPARLTCAGCGLARLGDAPVRGGRPPSGPADAHFGLPLWLQASCAGQTLWAYSLTHVAFLERLVSAGLRLRHRPAPTIYVNRRLASRLPRWILLAKHRAAVRRGLAELRALAWA